MAKVFSFWTPELIAYIVQLDLPLGLRGTLLVRHDGGAVNPRVGDEPAVRTGRELRLRKGEVVRMALNPHHNVRVGTHHPVDVHRDEELFRDLVPNPPDEILRAVTRE